MPPTEPVRVQQVADPNPEPFWLTPDETWRKLEEEHRLRVVWHHALPRLRRGIPTFFPLGEPRE